MLEDVLGEGGFVFFEAHDFLLENVVQKNRRGLFTFRKEVNVSKIVTQSPEQPVVM